MTTEPTEARQDELAICPECKGEGGWASRQDDPEPPTECLKCGGTGRLPHINKGQEMTAESKCPICGQIHIIEKPYRKQTSPTTYITNIPNLILAQAIKEAREIAPPATAQAVQR